MRTFLFHLFCTQSNQLILETAIICHAKTWPHLAFFIIHVVFIQNKSATQNARFYTKCIAIHYSQQLLHLHPSVYKVHWILKTNIFFLSVSAGRTVFTSFLKSEFSEENMDFWVACEDYKKTSPSKRASQAKQIYQQYVEADAPREVMTFIWNRW